MQVYSDGQNITPRPTNLLSTEQRKKQQLTRVSTKWIIDPCAVWESEAMSGDTMADLDHAVAPTVVFRVEVLLLPKEAAAFRTADHLSAVDESRLESECLRSNNELLLSNQWSDCRIEAGGEEFPAHRAVLSARSVVFREMFGNPMNLEAQTGLVRTVGFDPEAVRALLQHIYTGSTDCVGERIRESVLQLADYYNLPRLKLHLERVLASTITLRNIVPMLHTVDTNHCSVLKEACVRLIGENRREIVKTVEWRGMRGTLASSNLAVEALEWVLCGEPASIEGGKGGVEPVGEGYRAPTTLAVVEAPGIGKNEEEEFLPSACLDAFGQMLSSGLGTDCTIETAEGRLSAHRAILCQRSSIFAAQFASLGGADSPLAVEIEGYSIQAVWNSTSQVPVTMRMKVSGEGTAPAYLHGIGGTAGGWCWREGRAEGGPTASCGLRPSGVEEAHGDETDNLDRYGEVHPAVVPGG